MAGLRRRYGKDKTFAVPILTNCALAGLVPWREVAPLPFELACLPHPLLRFLRLPVVSYAMPALVAIGQARYFHRPPRNPLAAAGAAAGRRAEPGGARAHAAGQRRLSGSHAADELRRDEPGRASAGPSIRWSAAASSSSLDSVRADGCWPIDTNLATWATTLAVNALAGGRRRRRRDWAASTGCSAASTAQVHPFTHAAPGGWGWTDLSGAVPDADDTAGALLALDGAARSRAAERAASAIDAAAAAGVGWLLGPAERDGGWPTFCRGWGTLPFDRSGADLTAHALRGPARRGGRRLPRRRRIDAADRPRGSAYLRPAAAAPTAAGCRSGSATSTTRPRRTRCTAPPGCCWPIATWALIGEPAARRALALAGRATQTPTAAGGDPADRGSGRGLSSVEETALAVEALLAADDDPALQPADRRRT